MDLNYSLCIYIYEFITILLLIQLVVTDKTQNLRRLEAQRNELNAKGIVKRHHFKKFYNIDCKSI